MRDLFLGCAHVRTYVAVTLRNVNLQSCLGISICAHAQESGVTETCISRGRQWRMKLGGERFLAMEGGDSAAGPLQCTDLVESSVEMSNEHSQQLVTLTKKKAKRSVHRTSQENKKKTRKSSKEESTYWRVFTSQVLLAPTNQQCGVPRNTHRHTGTWHSTRYHTHAYL